MGMPKSKFEIINEVISQKNNKITITELCRIAGVSRSGYYKWLSTYEKSKMIRTRQILTLLLKRIIIKDIKKEPEVSI